MSIALNEERMNYFHLRTFVGVGLVHGDQSSGRLFATGDAEPMDGTLTNLRIGFAFGDVDQRLDIAADGHRVQEFLLDFAIVGFFVELMEFFVRPHHAQLMDRFEL